MIFVVLGAKIEKLTPKKRFFLLKNHLFRPKNHLFFQLSKEIFKNISTSGFISVINVIYIIFQRSVSEFTKSKPSLKSPKNRFQLSAGLNLEFNATLMEPTIFELRFKSKPRLKFFKFDLFNDQGRNHFYGSYSSPKCFH